jgi:putative ABC transport system substrate-binding protein
LSQGSPPSGAHPNLEAFREGLRVLGWVEGENLVIEYRWAGIRDDRLPALAAELVRLPVDVIFATPDVAAHAAKNATTTIPIVFRGHPDPVGRELITSLAQPGGNITGLSTMLTELSGKRLELLKEAVPEVTRVAVLWNPASPRHTQPGLEQTLAWTETQRAAHALGVQLQLVAAEGPDAFDRAFAAMTRERAEALVVLPHVLFGTHRRRLIALAAERRLPTIFWRGFFAEDGALMAYGPNLRDEYRHAAAYVDKILKGTKPGDLPVEQPTTFELVINLKTAQALGLTIPSSLLFQATEVIR